MFGSRSRYQNDSFSKHRAGKSTSKKKGSFKESSKRTERLERVEQIARPSPKSVQTSPSVGGAIITLCVGHESRLFAAHEEVLCNSPYFATACRGQFFEPTARRIDLPDEEPEIFSSILEFLYKGDYYPRMEYDKKRQTWGLEDANVGRGESEATIWHSGVGGPILKDTVIYCSADRYGLDDLKRLALRKQGLQCGIQCSTILTSARFAYNNTPDSDGKLRAHYLALIIRSRQTFKRSGTMQNEMEQGGKLFFDLFVAMVNHMDDLTSAARSPR